MIFKSFYRSTVRNAVVKNSSKKPLRAGAFLQIYCPSLVFKLFFRGGTAAKRLN